MVWTLETAQGQIGGKKSSPSASSSGAWTLETARQSVKTISTTKRTQPIAPTKRPTPVTDSPKTIFSNIQESVLNVLSKGKKAVSKVGQTGGLKTTTRESDKFPFPDYSRSSPGQKLRADLNFEGKGDADIIFHIKTPNGKVIKVPQTKEKYKGGKNHYGLELVIPKNTPFGIAEVWATVNGKEVSGSRKKHEIVKSEAIDRYKRTPDNKLVAGTDTKNPTLAREKLVKREGLGAPIGRLLQKTPDTTFRNHPKHATETEKKVVEFLSGLPGAIAQSYGRSLEMLSTPDGKKQIKEGAKNLPKTTSEIKTHIDNKEWGKAFETAFANPALAVALDVSDFIPVAGIAGYGLKKSGKALLKQTVLLLSRSTSIPYWALCEITAPYARYPLSGS